MVTSDVALDPPRLVARLAAAPVLLGARRVALHGTEKQRQDGAYCVDLCYLCYLSCSERRQEAPDTARVELSEVNCEA